MQNRFNEWVTMILASALVCLSANIFHEARGEPILGQYAVASVVMNRAAGRQDQVCKVVLAKNQFSWTTRMVRYQHGLPVLNVKMTQADAWSWDIAMRVARTTLNGQMIDVSKGATFYFRKDRNPIWRHALVPTTQIGQHLFLASR
jgi:spore germination cell wall hydrolase CwlJ-like protein